MAMAANGYGPAPQRPPHHGPPSGNPGNQLYVGNVGIISHWLGLLGLLGLEAKLGFT